MDKGQWLQGVSDWAEPSEGAFHNPTAGHLSALAGVEQAEDGSESAAQPTYVLAEAAAGVADVPHRGRTGRQRDQDGQYESHCIDEKVPFPPCDAFATIVASHSCRCNAGLDRLTIDTAKWDTKAEAQALLDNRDVRRAFQAAQKSADVCQQWDACAARFAPAL